MIVIIQARKYEIEPITKTHINKVSGYTFGFALQFGIVYLNRKIIGHVMPFHIALTR